jgi:hypothetical protein
VKEGAEELNSRSPKTNGRNGSREVSGCELPHKRITIEYGIRLTEVASDWQGARDFGYAFDVGNICRG